MSRAENRPWLCRGGAQNADPQAWVALQIVAGRAERPGHCGVNRITHPWPVQRYNADVTMTLELDDCHAHHPDGPCQA